MRAFISINIDPDIKKKITTIQNSVKDEISKINKDFLNSIKWESSDKFHMTLFFLGDIDESTLSKLDSSLIDLQNNYSSNEIFFSAKGINAFPKLKFPSVIIIELENMDGRVFKLSNKINEIAKKSGFISDKHFHPHITLGRVKRDRKIILSELENKINTDLNFSVKNFYLMESKLSSLGSEYSVIKEYRLDN